MLALIFSALRSLHIKIRMLRANGHAGCDKKILQSSALEIGSGMVRAIKPELHKGRKGW